VQETRAGHQGTIRDIGHVKGTRDLGILRRERTCKLEARTREQGMLRREGICARDNVQEIKEHRKHKGDNVQEIKERWETQCAGDQGT